jgi:hypothetical protein
LLWSAFGVNRTVGPFGAARIGLSGSRVFFCLHYASWLRSSASAVTATRAGSTLPTKIVTQVLKPIDIVAQFGEDPDVDEVDAHVRRVMQKGLDELAAKRCLPILG